MGDIHVHVVTPLRKQRRMKWNLSFSLPSISMQYTCNSFHGDPNQGTRWSWTDLAHRERCHSHECEQWSTHGHPWIPERPSYAAPTGCHIHVSGCGEKERKRARVRGREGGERGRSEDRKWRRGSCIRKPTVRTSTTKLVSEHISLQHKGYFLQEHNTIITHTMGQHD